jgi:hypothetical protein
MMKLTTFLTILASVMASESNRLMSSSSGRDPLTYERKLPIYAENFDEPSLTPDGLFEIPHGYHGNLLAETGIQLSSELFIHFHNETSTGSEKYDASAKICSFGGSFSSDRTWSKESSIGSDARRVRVRAQRVLYQVATKTSAQFSPEFEFFLNDTARLVETGNSACAVVSVDDAIERFGALEEREVFLGQQLVYDTTVSSSYVFEKSASTVKRAAAASFASFAKFSYESTESHEDIQEFESHVTASRVNTFGGQPFVLGNSSLVDWMSTPGNQLTILDWNGAPVAESITCSRVPWLDCALVQTIQAMYSNRTQVYLALNKYGGCTTMGAKSFDPIANVDDGSCTAPTTNTTIGGAFQQCSGESTYCDPFQHVNVLTGDYTCPEHFAPELVRSTVEHRTTTSKDRCCHSCWLAATCCNDCYHTHTHTVSIDSSVCFANTHPMPPQSGVYSGGYFTANVVNPMTRDYTCPEYYYEQPIMETLDDTTGVRLCFSHDYSLAYSAHATFGGLGTCQTPNPFANGTVASCPSGTTQYSSVVQSCLFTYCIDPASMPEAHQPAVKRPISTCSMKSKNPNTTIITGNTTISFNNQTWAPPSVHVAQHGGHFDPSTFISVNLYIGQFACHECYETDVAGLGYLCQCSKAAQPDSNVSGIRFADMVPGECYFTDYGPYCRVESEYVLRWSNVDGPLSTSNQSHLLTEVLAAAGSVILCTLLGIYLWKRKKDAPDHSFPSAVMTSEENSATAFIHGVTDEYHHHSVHFPETSIN